ncbi:MAG: WS/DGAT domain-containing protein [Kiritimatiellia bacterium]
MSRIDATWLRVESPATPFVIHGMFRVEGPASPGELIELMRERLPRLRRLRQRAVDGAPRAGGWWHGEARWIDDPDFSFDRHVRLHPYIEEAEFPEMVNRIQPQPLDFRGPPWEVHVFPLTSGAVRFLLRFHHCIGDGAAMGRVLRQMCDGAPEVIPMHTVAPDRRPAVLRWADILVRRPLALLRMVLLTRADPEMYRGPPGPDKPGAWTPALPLDPVMRMRERSGATVNEILTAVVCEALRRDALSRGRDPARAVIRATVPVNLRRADEQEGLGNRFGLVYLRLPLDGMDFDERLALVRRRMLSRKRAQQGQAFLETLRRFGTFGPRLHRWMVGLLTSKSSLVLTHVRGPDEPVRAGGRQLTEVSFFAPQSGSIGLSISLLTYAGTVTIGVQADARCHPDPGALARRCAEVFRETLGA